MSQQQQVEMLGYTGEVVSNKAGQDKDWMRHRLQMSHRTAHVPVTQAASYAHAM